MNVAVTVRAAASDTVQVIAVAQVASLHPVNVEPSAAVAVSVTLAPGA